MAPQDGEAEARSILGNVPYSRRAKQWPTWTGLGAHHECTQRQAREWAKGDVFVVPNWHWHEHRNRGPAGAFLFSVTDQPVMEKLGLFREEAYPDGDGRQPVVGPFQPY